MSEQTTLWCVNIHGPDDVIAQPDYLSAIKAANAFNAFWQKLTEKEGQHPYDPRVWAVPIEWPHDADSHAESLIEAAKPTAEYAWLNASQPIAAE